jgi:pilus assembly protein CpaE
VDQVARVVLGLETPDVAEEVLHFLDRSGRARVVATAGDDRQLRDAVVQCDPDAVVAEPSLAAGGGLVAPLLALATRESVAVLRAAVEAGASGFYVWPGERDALLDGVGRCTTVARGSLERRAVVVAVHGSRGGVGATFVATQLADAVRRTGEACVLIDADLESADVTFALGMAADAEVRTVADLVPVAGELSWSHVEEVQVGGAVLAPPVDRLDEVDDGLVRALVTLAAASVDLVVVLVSRSLSGLSGWCLEQADVVLEVLTLEPSSFRAAARTIEAVCPDGSDDRWRLVVNKAQRAELTVGDVERAFGVGAFGVVPFDPAAARASARGGPVSGRGRAARAIARLAAALREPDVDDRAS